LDVTDLLLEQRGLRCAGWGLIRVVAWAPRALISQPTSGCDSIVPVMLLHQKGAVSLCLGNRRLKHIVVSAPERCSLRYRCLEYQWGIF